MPLAQSIPQREGKLFMDAREIKRLAKQYGADIVGIASMDRFEGAPKQMDPRYIMPRAKSMIVMGFRIMRGSLRGIEEGTHFSNYAAMGYGFLNFHYMPLTVVNLAKEIEDEGYEAIPIGYQHWWKAINGTTDELKGGPDKPIAKPVEEGKPIPEVMTHMRVAAYLAGLGEFGWSKVFLTPEFGPRQRFGMVMTEMELEPDPIYEGPKLCNRCMACARECPGQAISTTESVKVTLAGHEVEWGKLNERACGTAFKGAEKCAPGERGTYIAGSDKFKPSYITPFYKKPNSVYITGEAICGGRGCIRACMIELEKRGVVGNKFKYDFRVKKPWRVDWSDYDPNDDRPRT